MLEFGLHCANGTGVTHGVVKNFKTKGLTKYQMMEGRHSGEGMTSVGNSGNNMWISHTAYTLTGIADNLVGSLILGDDNWSVFGGKPDDNL